MSTSRTFRRLAAAALTGTALMAATATGASAAAVVPNPQVAEGDAGATDVTIPVDLPAPSLAIQTVFVTTVDGTAKAGSDYTALNRHAVRFAPLQIHKDVTLQLAGDTLHEADETFVVQIENGVPFADQVVTILNDDAAPSVSVADATVNERDAAARFDISLSAPSGVPTTVDWATADGSAQAGSDYAANSGKLTFAPGETTKTVAVDVTNDAINEPSEDLLVRLSAPAGAALGRSVATGTILDDDPAPAPAPQDAQSRSDGQVGPAVANALLSRLSYAGLTKRGAVRLTAWCPTGPGCAGAVTLRAGGRTIGTAGYVLRPGAKRVITVKLSRAARTTLARRHRLRVVARTGGGPVKRFTVKR